MIAPIDARATLDAGGETFELALNMRTLALAKAAGVNIFKLDLAQADPLDLATLVAAFAKPAHPEIEDEHALAIIVRFADAARKALETLFKSLAAEAGTEKANPRKPRGASPTS